MEKPISNVIDDPVKLINRIFSSFKGKYSSVELQHESGKLWTNGLRKNETKDSI